MAPQWREVNRRTIMCTTTASPEQVREDARPGPWRRMLRRLLAHRVREAEAYAIGHLSRLEDADLTGMGLTAEEIASLRSGVWRTGALG
jgi:hypothetical protein